MYYRQQRITRELYDFLVREKVVDAALIRGVQERKHMRAGREGPGRDTIQRNFAQALLGNDPKGRRMPVRADRRLEFMRSVGERKRDLAAKVLAPLQSAPWRVAGHTGLLSAAREAAGGEVDGSG